MSLIIFLIILSALIIVHEVGHFFVAKFFNIRVDEFGLGYPPKAKKLFSWRGTDFTLNWLPFGGFVRIFGENPAQNDAEQTQNVAETIPHKSAFDPHSSASSNSFQSKNRGIQAAVLVAGVVMNLLFAWVLLSLGFMIGLPAPESLGLPVDNARTTITAVLPGTPADEAGLLSGDVILSLEREGVSLGLEASLSEVSEFIGSSLEQVTFYIDRAGEELEISVEPELSLAGSGPAVGIAMDSVGTVTLGPIRAFWEGLRSTIEFTQLTAVALGVFIWQVVSGQADLSLVTGPVGLVGMVGSVANLGLAYLLSFTAIISINLALINLVPFPALDGGRLLFVAIESVTRRPVPPKFFNILNTIGFALLILLMVLVTVQDVRNIF